MEFGAEGQGTLVTMHLSALSGLTQTGFDTLGGFPGVVGKTGHCHVLSNQGWTGRQSYRSLANLMRVACVSQMLSCLAAIY